MEHPFDDAGLLAARVNADQSEERLAALLIKSGILAEVLPHLHWKPHDTGVDLGTAACMLKALIAAYVHKPGGHFYSAVRLALACRRRRAESGHPSPQLCHRKVSGPHTNN